MTTPDNTASLDLAANVRIAQGLVRTLEEQQAALDAAKAAGWAAGHAAGWAECGEALASFATEQWQAGYWACEEYRQARWEELSAQIRGLGAPGSRTFEERRAVEIAACQPRPGDFPGVDNDPHCLDRCRTSVESIAHDTRRAA